ncbi:MAG: hypothetical protein WDO12_12600 [Pseudomonadota bacterium]
MGELHVADGDLMLATTQLDLALASRTSPKYSASASWRDATRSAATCVNSVAAACASNSLPG